MKKFMKLGKILLLIATVFSYLSSPISVLAEEIINSEVKPLVLNLAATEGEGGVLEYLLTYISGDPSDYEDDKNYKIELDTTVTYTNGDEELLSEKEFSVLGSTLNSVRSSYKLDSPILEHYNGEYVLAVTVLDGETEIYSEELEYEAEYNAPVGLTGQLKGESVVNETTIGNYDVTTEGKYTQSLNILAGELSPIGMYRVLNNDGTYTDVMTGEVLRTTEFVGTETDLTGKLGGKYSYTDSVTFEEVELIEGSEEVNIINTYTYDYTATINYNADNDTLFTEAYTGKVAFVEGYMAVLAKDFMDNEVVITIKELVEDLALFEGEKESKTTIEVLDSEGNVLDLTDLEVLASEVKNDYVVKFTNGATADYEVVVVGDADLDNDFDMDDLIRVMEGYLDEENMPSMDMVTLDKEVEGDQEPVAEEIGTITFEDVIVNNELLKGEDGDFEEKEIGTATIVFGEVPELVYVGDSFEVEVLVSAEMVEELIDGIDGLVTCTNMKLDDVSYVEFNSLLTGVSNSEGRLVAVASDGLADGTVLMTLTFIATEEGIGTISFVGNVSRYLSMAEVELNAEVEIIRNISTNNNLSSLNSSVGTFDVEFDKDVTVYTLTVPYDTESVIISGELEDMYSVVEGLIEYELTEDKTTAIINVTAEDGSVKTYTVYIIKEAKPVTQPVVYYYSSNNYLKSLEVDGYDVEFDKYTNEYKIAVKNGVTSLDITALAEDYRARVEITGNADFKDGENVVTITVTAENGSTREYKLIVDKEDKKAVSTIDDSSNTAEKIVIIVLIVLVVLGLLYLIFKKDGDEKVTVAPVKNEEPKVNKNNNGTKNTVNNSKNKHKKKK